MNKGGISPSICSGSFTSYKSAQMVLEQYLEDGDRNGRSRYPSKVKAN